MNNFNKLRVTLFSKIGANYGKIKRIPNNIYNRLLYKYHDKLPASYYLLFKDIPNNSMLLKCLLLTTVLPKDKEYSVNFANSTVFGEHIYVECDDKVYDPEIGMIVDSKFYQIMFGLSDIKVATKELVDEYIEEQHIAKDSIADCQYVEMDVLDRIDDQYRNYNGDKKELLDRQVPYFFNEIHYEDGVMYIPLDENKKSK